MNEGIGKEHNVSQSLFAFEELPWHFPDRSILFSKRKKLNSREKEESCREIRVPRELSVLYMKQGMDYRSRGFRHSILDRIRNSSSAYYLIIQIQPFHTTTRISRTFNRLPNPAFNLFFDGLRHSTSKINKFRAHFISQVECILA